MRKKQIKSEISEEQLVAKICNTLEDNTMKFLTGVNAGGEVADLMKAVTKELSKRWMIGGITPEKKSSLLTLEDV